MRCSYWGGEGLGWGGETTFSRTTCAHLAVLLMCYYTRAHQGGHTHGVDVAVPVGCAVGCGTCMSP